MTKSLQLNQLLIKGGPRQGSGQFEDSPRICENCTDNIQEVLEGINGGVIIFENACQLSESSPNILFYNKELLSIAHEL